MSPELITMKWQCKLSDYLRLFPSLLFFDDDDDDDNYYYYFFFFIRNWKMSCSLIIKFFRIIYSIAFLVDYVESYHVPGLLCICKEKVPW